MADQFLKGETMTVHQVEAATTELQLHDLLLGLQLSGGCLYLVHHHGLPLEELVRHGQVLHQEEGGEEEEAQEGEADNLHPASQPGSTSQWSDETRRLATATGRDPKLVFTSISWDRDNSRDWNLGLTSLVLAASCWQCCTSGLNTVRNAAVSGARSETSSWLLQQVWREHVICEDWVHGMPCPLWQPGKGGDDLGHGDRQHCGQWRHQRLLATSDTAQPQPQTAG